MGRYRFGLHFPVTVLHFCKTPFQIYIDCRPFSHRRGSPDPVSQILADPAAQIQAKAAGFFVVSAIIAGIALFKYPGDVLRSNTYTVVPDTEDLPFLPLYDNFSLRPGIF